MIHSVLRGTFDQWLAELAEGAGAEYICGIPVEELVKDGSGSVVGIRAGDDAITAHVVIDCEGVNSLLAERCLGVARPKPSEMAVGVKEVFELTEAQVEDRFLVQRGEGAAMLFVGDCTHGVVGGGFMYTNRDSVSLGLVATISELEESDTTIYQALADFKEHPAVAPIIRGASMVEHSGHMVSEGGFSMVPRYCFDGCLLAGDTAMLCMNLGYQVRGMDFAIASGRFAAEAACDAIDAGDVSATGMASYMAKLEDSFVMKGLETFKTWPRTMEGWESMFADYPGMAAEVFEAMFAVNGVPQRHLKDRIAPIVRKHGIFKLLKEMRGALKAL
ncbi:FAD-dependent oxidoreductase [Ellagibacter isourolithinifaciens]|uniref:FAD-dependent oxidoreductase n=1 Tax=Ellagibacter isourolithinifaciens TaxID=2137581 RepID=UPI003A9531EA